MAVEHLAEFKSLAAGVLEIARDEANTLQHDWFFNDDGRAAWTVDDRWRFAHITDSTRSLWIHKDGISSGSVAVGREHHFDFGSDDCGHLVCRATLCEWPR